MSTIATDTSSPIPPRDKAYPPEAGHYSMNENVEDNKKDTHLAVEDNVWVDRGQRGRGGEQDRQTPHMDTRQSS